nr:chitobiase/beta-hexosaminidase C-terminal domain-containing protein [uncultured Niameybacter sp.]
MKKQGLVNIYHFIRKSTYNDGIFTQEDFDTLRMEIDILKQYQLPATYALKYDAVMDERYAELIKSTIDEKDEVGAWWEITQEMAEKAGVHWKGCDVIDLHVKAGYSLAYLPEERKRLLDVYMEDFKGVYGYYPKTIGSWVMDIVTFSYAKEKYGVIGGALCRDQKGTDGFTLWGGYVNGAYYPSKINEHMPAQTEDMQLDLPIFKLLGPDPIYNFESEVRRGAEGIYTLEPAWTCGQSEEWVKWIFERITDEEQLGYGYTQAGQENSFIWGNMGEAYEMQVRHIAKLRDENKIRVESLRDSSIWFKNKYELTPPVSYTATTDWNKYFDLKTTWYSSRFYRSSLMLEKGILSIRDLFIYDENYASRYLDYAIENNESVFDALPILDACYWSTGEKRASMEFINLATDKLIQGKDVSFNGKEDDKTWLAKWDLGNEGTLNIVHTEEAMTFVMDGIYSEGNWGIRMNTMPVLKEIKEKELICEHRGFTYSLKVENGIFRKEEDGVMILPASESCKLTMAQNIEATNLEVFQDAYLQNSKAFDEEVEKPFIQDQEKLKDVKLIKPMLSHKAKVKRYDEVVYCTMTNPNEGGTIHYTVDGSIPTQDSPIYKEPIKVEEDCIVKACIIKEGRPTSDVAEAKYYNTLCVEEISSPTKFDGRKIFNRNGVRDLIDGKKGSLNHTDDCWLATLNEVEVVMDLGKLYKLESINMGFMHSRRSGPCYPKYVKYYVSSDGVNYEEVFSQNVHEVSGNPDIGMMDVVGKINIEGRYVKVIAKPYTAFIFTDQIIIQGK